MKGFITGGHIGAAVAVIALLIILLMVLIAVQPTMNKIEWEEETYIVKSGDTLWRIADKYCPDIVDKREWIAEVQELNNLHSSVLHPGQSLKVLVPAT